MPWSRRSSNEPKELEKILFQERFIKLGNDSGGGIAGLIAARDPLLAVRWSLALQSLLERQGAIVSVLGYQMDHQGDAAAMRTIELAAKAIPRKNLLRAVVDIKAREDPVLAAAWIRQQPDDKPNRELYTTLVGVWYQQDGIAASSWVGQLPPGKGRDSAAQALVLAVQESDVSSAISWGAAIQDDDMRQRTLSQIKSHQSVEQIRQTIQALGSSVKLSEADLEVLLNDGEPGN